MQLRCTRARLGIATYAAAFHRKSYTSTISDGRNKMSKKNRESIQALFARTRHELLAFLTRRVGSNAAPDLLQETYVRILRRGDIDTIIDVNAFLRTTALNLARDFARRGECEAKYFAPGDLRGEIAGSDGTPDQIYEAGEKAHRLLEVIDALPPRCRQVFIMRRFDDLSQDQIAERLGISRNMVEKHLRLGLERCLAADE